MEAKLKLTPIAKCGGSRKGALTIPYEEIVDLIFKPNATELDDPQKVKASWGFIDESGREAFSAINILARKKLVKGGR